MRWPRLFFLLVGLFLPGLFTSEVPAQKAPYKIELLSKTPDVRTVSEKGRNVTKITLRFKVSPTKAAQGDEYDYKVVIEQAGKSVWEENLPKSIIRDALSVVLSMDTSGSMEEIGKMQQAQQAAQLFFDELPVRADAGLILFNDKIYFSSSGLSKDRDPLISRMNSAKAEGGTAYLDSCLTGISMLEDVQHKKKAIVVMTDGVDLNSKSTKEEVIAKANHDGVKIYTVGIGKAGDLEKVTSILVLDRSGSMEMSAEKSDKESKLQALQAAAKGFVDTVRYTEEELIRTSILQFSDSVSNPINFTNNKDVLNSVIDQLQAKGETALFDATYAGIEALSAENPPGRKAVIALTDGIDNSSRRREKEIIDRAKQEGIRLYTLGFGPKGQLAEDVLQRMADQTGGKYYHASNKEDLMKIFENLSLKLHDDGIDEATLRELAEKTGGQYKHAENIADLKFILKDVTIGLQEMEFKPTFNSRFGIGDGRTRDLEFKLVRLGISEGGFGDGDDSSSVIAGPKVAYFRKGLLIAQMDPFVYLALLGVLGVLMILPAMMGRRKQTGATR